MRRRVRGPSLDYLQNKAWKRAYYFVGYNPKTNKINFHLRKLRNSRRTW